VWTHLFKRPFSADWSDFRHAVGANAIITSVSTDLEPESRGR
jgi:hypothetical protein